MAKELRDVVGHLFEVDVLRRVRLQKAASDSGLYFGQLPILQFIHEHPGCTQREIADKIGVTSASVALSTKRMQKSGLLTKEIDSQDLRCNRLELTETGIEYMNTCTQKFDEVDQLLFRGFSEEELGQLDALLEKVVANLTEESRLSDRFELFRLANRLGCGNKDCMEDEV